MIAEATIATAQQSSKQAAQHPARVYHFHTNLVGAPLEATDETGEIAWAGKYDAWGKVEYGEDALLMPGIDQPLRFAGQYADEGTGLHYNTFRFYDPDVGRFISQDPIGMAGGDNLYAYAPNPTGWIDPLGWMCGDTPKTGVQNQGLGKTLGRYSAVKPGPLADNLASTFGGGRYRVVKLQNDTILYRGGKSDSPLGQFFSLEPPTGVLQTRIDKAVLPVSPGGGTSPIDTAFTVKIPAGTEVYIGNVGSQGGHYVGGTQQIVVSKPWTIDGVQVINSSPLK